AEDAFAFCICVSSSLRNKIIMRKKPVPQSGGAFNVRIFLAFTLCLAGAWLAMLSFATQNSTRGSGPTLRLEKLTFPATSSRAMDQSTSVPVAQTAVTAAAPVNAPTFGHPIIAGIGGTGFEESIRIDPTDPNRIYTSAPGTLSADTSW